MYRRIAPYVGRSVLEAGCGIGNLTELLLDSDRLVVSDFDPFYVEMIHRRFGHLEIFRAVPMDLARGEDYASLADVPLDTIICLNVLEHIAADEEVLGHFHRALQPGGHAIILVPQHPGLYSPTDRTLGHVRRYTEAELHAKLTRAGFEVVHQRGFKRLGTLGWYVSGKLLGKAHLSAGQMKVFNRIVPLARLIEHVPAWPALSTIAVGEETASSIAGLPFAACRDRLMRPRDDRVGRLRFSGRLALSGFLSLAWPRLPAPNHLRRRGTRPCSTRTHDSKASSWPVVREPGSIRSPGPSASNCSRSTTSRWSIIPSRR